MRGSARFRPRYVIDAIAENFKRGRSGRAAPALTVVMPVYNVAEYLPEALDSVLGQSFTDLELITVDDGSTDDSLQILRDRSLLDGRLRVLTQPNAGQGAARNRGVTHARGEFLTFVDSDDVVPRTAYEHMIGSLRLSGSDFNVGSVVRLQDGRTFNTSWVRTVHWSDQLRVSLESFPEAMHDIICCNRMFRTSFWREQVGDFETGHAYEDHLPLLRAYVRADSFDVLAEVTYHWRVRRSSTGQQKSRTGNLRDRILVKQQADTFLRAEATPYIHALWVARVLEVDFPPFVQMARTANAEYRDLVSRTMRSFLDMATPASLARVRVINKVRSRLAAAGEWEQLEAAEAYFRDVGSLPPTRMVDGHIEADLPRSPGFLTGLDGAVLRMAPHECQFQGVIGRLEWTGGGLNLVGWAGPRGVSVTRAARHRAWLVDEDQRIELPTRTISTPAANWSSNQQYADRSTGFSAFVAFSEMPRKETSWWVEVELEQSGLVVSGPLAFREAESGVGVPKAWEVELAGEPAQIQVGWTKPRGLRIEVCLDHPSIDPGRAVAEVRSIDFSGEQRTLSLTVDHPGVPGKDVRAWALGNRRSELSMLGIDSDDGTSILRWSLEASSGRPAPSQRLRLHPGKPGDSRPLPLSREMSMRAPIRLFDAICNVRVGQPRRGSMVLDLMPPLAPDELGAFHQQCLRNEYWSHPSALTGSAFFQCGDGHGPAGHQRTLDRLLAEREPEFDRVWGVKDFSVQLPPGAIPVVVGSRQWYAAIARARFIASDDALDARFRPRRGQPCLRTFASDIFDRAGRSLWESQGWPEHEIRDAQRSLTVQWDLLLAESDHDAREYRRQFDFDGEVIVLDGGPRDGTASDQLWQRLMDRSNRRVPRPDPCP